MSKLSQNSINLLEIVLKIANYSGFSKNEILSWTKDELDMALEFIRRQEQEQASVQLAIVDYQILLSREFDKKQQSEAKKCQAQAQKIRNILTGVKPKKSSLLSVFQSFGIYTNKKIKE